MNISARTLLCMHPNSLGISSKRAVTSEASVGGADRHVLLCEDVLAQHCEAFFVVGHSSDVPDSDVPLQHALVKVDTEMREACSKTDLIQKAVQEVRAVRMPACPPE